MFHSLALTSDPSGRIWSWEILQKHKVGPPQHPLKLRGPAPNQAATSTHFASVLGNVRGNICRGGGDGQVGAD